MPKFTRRDFIHAGCTIAAVSIVPHFLDKAEAGLRLHGSAVATAYVGPGDIKPGAFAWWGYRAYNTAYATAGSPAIDLVDQAGANLVTINVKSDGTIDKAAVAAWVTAHSVTGPKVTKFWDQTGNGWHLTQATLAKMPDYVISTDGFGDGTQPSLGLVKASGYTMSSAATGLSTPTGTFSVMVQRTLADSFGGIIQAGGFGPGWHGSELGYLYTGSGTASTFPLTHFNMHTFQAVFNGASSIACIDGTMNLTDDHSTSNLGSPFILGELAGGLPITGNIVEVGFWNSIWSQADCTAVDGNQKGFWWSKTKYEGLVASRCRVPATLDSTNKYQMARSAHIATENISTLRCFFHLAGTVTAFTASVEYPAGTFTQLKFLGSATFSQSLADVFSDYATVSIPAGATFWIRSFMNGPSGVYNNPWQNTFLGEATQLSVTAISDLTMGGTITNSGAFSVPPIAILSYTTNPSVVIVGDSIGIGAFDTEDTSNSATGYNAVVGIIARSLGSVPFINLSVSATGASGNVTYQHIWSKGSHFINELGTNDLYDFSHTAAQLETSLITMQNLISAAPYQKRYQTTLIPRTTSTDSWATIVNQSTITPGEPDRITFNAALRAGSTGLTLTGFFDTDSVIGTSTNNQDWIVTPTPPYCQEGVHPNTSGYAFVAASGIIPVPTFP